ncbi:TMEM175 family protein [Micromonospora sp. WMMD736]|uniref:TMEM175 family protein n=1 Tax=Micromonospora sp. WMMD736 TaxID=3404112 RepID=UPI003B9493B1
MTAATRDSAPANETDGTDRGLDRLVFFSDAVIAIAMTLLAIELPLPEGDDDAARWRSLGELVTGEYLSFLLSFVVIGAFWSVHHRLFQRVARMGPWIAWLNLIFLFTIVVLPLATRLHRQEGAEQVGVVVYAAVVVGVGVSLLLLLWQLHRAGLLRSDAPPETVRGAARAIAVPVLAFAVSIPVAFASTTAAEYTWLLPVVVLLVVRGYRRWWRA